MNSKRPRRSRRTRKGTRTRRIMRAVDPLLGKKEDPFFPVGLTGFFQSTKVPFIRYTIPGEQ